MPSARKRRAADSEDQDDHGEGFLSLDSGIVAQTPAGSSGRRPKTPKRNATLAAAAEPSTSGEEQARVMYIGNIPHGFYDKQMLGFFSQFGKRCVRLSRSKKTGKSKHYAFLEFQYPEVARIATEAMDGYFMFKQKLSCKLLSPDKVHPQLFVGANRTFKDIPWRKIERQRHDRERSSKEQAARIARLVKKDQSRQARIKAAGIEYEYEGLASKLPIEPKRIRITFVD